MPEDGPQLKKMLVGLTLLDSIMNGATIVLLRGGQYEEDDPPELELELEVEVEVETTAGAPVVPAAQFCFVIVVPFSVTAPFLARSLPFTVEPPSSVIDVRASIFPIRVVVVPNVAEEPTCQ